MKENKPRIAISIGDVNGIGLEVILKSLYHPKIYNLCTPVLYGNGKVVVYHKNIVEYSELQFYNISRAEECVDGAFNVLNVWNETVNIEIGKATKLSGKYAQLSLERAVEDVISGKMDALVTAPIHKAAMQMNGFKHIGHTEYLTEKSRTKDTMMFMISDELKVGLVTAHVAIRDVSKYITKELVSKRLRQLIHSLKVDFGVTKPQIAILGLNPHAGDNGYIGKEDQDIIRPVIIEAKKSGEFIYGPFGADGFFGSQEYKKYDGILAMYHDQGLIPFKTISFGRGINYTAGLSFVRTSPDHGTAYDIAGSNSADHYSFLNAIFKAIDIVRTRKHYSEDTKNPLKMNERQDEKD